MHVPLVSCQHCEQVSGCSSLVWLACEASGWEQDRVPVSRPSAGQPNRISSSQFKAVFQYAPWSVRGHGIFTPIPVLSHMSRCHRRITGIRDWTIWADNVGLYEEELNRISQQRKCVSGELGQIHVCAFEYKKWNKKYAEKFERIDHLWNYTILLCHQNTFNMY